VTEVKVEVGRLDTSVFVARENGRAIAKLPERVVLSVITIGELQLGVLNAGDPVTRSRRAAHARAGARQIASRSVRR
jgi:predicted nucleic acid-binding protein